MKLSDPAEPPDDVPRLGAALFVLGQQRHRSGPVPETQYFGPHALAAYRQEFDSSAAFIPLNFWWHVDESAMPLSTNSNILNARLGDVPEMIYRTDLAFYWDYGLTTATDPYREQPVILTAPTGEIIPHPQP